jgi:anti-sigma factor RsiW
MLTCRELVEVVTDYLDGALSPDRHAEVVAHLEDCEDCLRYLAQLQTTLRVLATVPSPMLSAQERTAVVEAFGAWCETAPVVPKHVGVGTARPRRPPTDLGRGRPARR